MTKKNTALRGFALVALILVVLGAGLFLVQMSGISTSTIYPQVEGTAISANAKISNGCDISTNQGIRNTARVLVQLPFPVEDVIGMVDESDIPYYSRIEKPTGGEPFSEFYVHLSSWKACCALVGSGWGECGAPSSFDKQTTMRSQAGKQFTFYYDPIDEDAEIPAELVYRAREESCPNTGKHIVAIQTFSAGTRLDKNSFARTPNYFCEILPLYETSVATGLPALLVQPLIDIADGKTAEVPAGSTWTIAYGIRATETLPLICEDSEEYYDYETNQCNPLPGVVYICTEGTLEGNVCVVQSETRCADYVFEGQSYPALLENGKCVVYLPSVTPEDCDGIFDVDSGKCLTDPDFECYGKNFDWNYMLCAYPACITSDCDTVCTENGVIVDCDTHSHDEEETVCENTYQCCDGGLLYSDNQCRFAPGTGSAPCPEGYELDSNPGSSTFRTCTQSAQAGPDAGTRLEVGFEVLVIAGVVVLIIGIIAVATFMSMKKKRGGA